jgi:hypothetical protein
VEETQALVKALTLQALVKALALQMPQLNIILSTSNSRLTLLHSKDLRLHFKARVRGLHVRFVGK